MMDDVFEFFFFYYYNYICDLNRLNLSIRCNAVLTQTCLSFASVAMSLWSSLQLLTQRDFSCR